MKTENFEIRDLKVSASEADLTNVVKSARFVYTATDDVTGKTFRMPSQVIFTTPGTNFIAYDEVTKEDVIAWIKETDVYTELVGRSDNFFNMTPSTITTVQAGKFPWNTIIEESTPTPE